MAKGWGISYRFNKQGSKWQGPCGIYFMECTKQMPLAQRSMFANFPVFFGTRKLGREEAAKHKNIQTKVSKYKLTWEEIE